MNESIEQPIPEPKPRSNSFFFKLLFASFVLGVFVLLAATGFIYQLNKPTTLSETVTVLIEEGDSVQLIAEKMEKAGLVKSGELLYFILATQFDPTTIKASLYVFEESLSTYETAHRLTEGDFDSNLQSLTVIEGESRRKIADRLSQEFDWFDENEFMLMTLELEGKLFPETYFIPDGYTTAELVTLLVNTYHNEIDTLLLGADTTLPENEIVTLASIVEREANSPESMGLVAGIFLNRLEIGMPLQADASIEYVIDEDLGNLRPGELAENLRELDSPYNTYRNPGLPPTPIGNPGRTALQAVITPTPSDYLYYITAEDGEFYYAETYNQHLRNIETYLR